MPHKSMPVAFKGDKVKIKNSPYHKSGDIGIVVHILQCALANYKVKFDDGEIVYFTRFEIEKVEDNDMALGTMEERTKGMKKQAEELIEQAYRRGFKAGQEEMQDKCEEKQKWIEQGRNEAWKTAVSIAKASNEMLHSMGFIVNHANNAAINSCFTIQRYTASEAIEKIHAWEEKKAEDDEIKVADEVIFNRDEPFNVIVTCIRKNDGEVHSYVVMGDNGMLWDYVKPSEITKTGRHFPEIAEVLERMKNGE